MLAMGTCARFAVCCSLQSPESIGNFDTMRSRSSTPVNHFYIYLRNFFFSDTGRSYPDLRGPVDWWRAIGDENLRSMRHLSLVGGPRLPNGTQEEDIRELVVTWKPGKTTTEKLGRDSGLEPLHDPLLDAELYPYSLSTALVAIQPDLAQLEVNELHVRGIESVAACLEYNSAQSLKDYSALEGNMEGVTPELLVNLQVKGERLEKARSRVVR